MIQSKTRSYTTQPKAQTLTRPSNHPFLLFTVGLLVPGALSVSSLSQIFSQHKLPGSSSAQLISGLIKLSFLSRTAYVRLTHVVHTVIDVDDEMVRDQYVDTVYGLAGPQTSEGQSLTHGPASSQSLSLTVKDVTSSQLCCMNMPGDNGSVRLDTPVLLEVCRTVVSAYQVAKDASSIYCRLETQHSTVVWLKCSGIIVQYNASKATRVCSVTYLRYTQSPARD